MTKYNFIMLKKVAESESGEKLAFCVLPLGNLQQLLGELKISIDKGTLVGIYTKEELNELKNYINKWEEDLYGT